MEDDQAGPRSRLPLLHGDAPESEQYAQFRQALRQAAALSTVGTATLSGRSAKSGGLVDLGVMLGAFDAAEDQVQAIGAILAEAATLWPDQAAHVIAQLIGDLVVRARITLRNGAHVRVAEAILRAAADLAPALLSESVVNDSIAHDLLACHTLLLSRRREFMARDPDEDWQPQDQANWLRNEINAVRHRQIEPEDLEPIIEATAQLPDSLRGRLLAMLVNVAWNTDRSAGNAALQTGIFGMIEQLPTKHRITPLEACCNQIHLLPHEHARRWHDAVARLVDALPETADARYNRARHDLQASLGRQKKLLAGSDFLHGETLRDHEHRIGRFRDGADRLAWDV